MIYTPYGVYTDVVPNAEKEIAPPKKAKSLNLTESALDKGLSHLCKLMSQCPNKFEIKVLEGGFRGCDGDIGAGNSYLYGTTSSL